MITQARDFRWAKHFAALTKLNDIAGSLWATDQDLIWLGAEKELKQCVENIFVSSIHDMKYETLNHAPMIECCSQWGYHDVGVVTNEVT